MKSMAGKERGYAVLEDALRGNAENSFKGPEAAYVLRTSRHGPALRN
jgi:hypothetical protein